jgi:hypothetical protein
MIRTADGVLADEADVVVGSEVNCILPSDDGNAGLYFLKYSITTVRSNVSKTIWRHYFLSEIYQIENRIGYIYN